ncbi:mucin-15 [Cavia porcellus]|uniref:Mucin 15, cell surface associated n=1 Tax=Cavia porcellus TaxID=10141 RepID=H0V5T4_CAVPO|nr:mucin-15 [Cavia porcellus]XP_013002726.1 mucin-15 [Cavia porcellus]XP_013002727.1 mucin-15 [Cavia porcellus]
MLTLAQIVLTSTLFISLPFESHETENLEKNTTQSTAGIRKTKAQTLVLGTEAKANPDHGNRTVSIPRATASDTAASSRNLTRGAFTAAVRPTAAFSTSPPLFHGFVSKLPLNSSLAEKNLLPVSAHPNSTWTASLDNLSWSLDNHTVYIPDNSSAGISVLPPVPAANQPATPMTIEPTGWLTADGDTFPDVTVTLQPTLRFTNNSKVFPSTSGPQKENRNTGVVFGAILGTILGVSLLSLIGYLLCGKRKTDSFSHRRLYDDRNEPVLRLDNTPEPYDGGFGGPSFYNPSVNDCSMSEGPESTRDGIPMDDIPPLRTAV